MNIGIAGAGLIGRLLAWQCLRAGHSVSLFDRDTIDGEGSAARVAAAMLAPYSEAAHCPREIFDWGVASMALWPRLIRQLHQDTGINVQLEQNGSVVVAHIRDTGELDNLMQLLGTKLPEHQAQITLLDQPALASLEPSLAGRFEQGIFLSGEGCLDNWALLDALADAIDSLGGEWHAAVSVDNVQPGQLDVEGQPISFDCVIDSRGLGAKPNQPGLRGVRGEVLWVHAPEVSLTRPVRLMHPRYQLYIAPKPQQRYVIGATEIESESMQPITVRSSLELQSALYSIDTDFAEASILKAYANCRPAYVDNLPRIDVEEGLISVNGLYRHGYLLSPLLLQLALDSLDGQVEHPVVRQQSSMQEGIAR